MTTIIYGRQPVLAALRRGNASLEEILVAGGLGGRCLAEARNLARAQGLRLKQVPRSALDRLCRTANHQGIAARRGAFAYLELEELLGRLAALREPALLVVADSLTDPMNLGNLCRSALAAGAHGLIIPKDRAAGVTPTVIKAAAGALEVLPVCRVTNLAETLMRLKEADLWVAGADAGADQSLYEADLTVPLALVIGGEDTGIRPRVRRQCDMVLAIPLASEAVSSLNAAAAGAVALFETRRQRLAKTRPA
jgi:23S rRNA (guanosine2251-2'-O)-methyltransferase|uniref:23S rRNA (Guanosine(2251)-2'-O)-methyltransferase RlmB n=1 Tax=Desulfobacca acetoxidans TaxID=60893 RepID=A0A7V6DQB8_9BACT